MMCNERENDEQYGAEMKNKCDVVMTVGLCAWFSITVLWIWGPCRTPTEM